jgi:hypothetical protein
LPVGVDGAPWVLDVRMEERKRPHLHLCNESGFPLSRLAPKVVAPGFSFAAYLKIVLSQLNENNLPDVSRVVPELNGAVQEAREKLREDFRARAVTLPPVGSERGATSQAIGRRDTAC